MRTHPRIAWLLGVGILLAGINVFHTFGPIHLHNDGPLGSLSGASFAFDTSTSGPWTAGYELCVQSGSDPIVIESISPVSVAGSGLKYLGAYVREIQADTSRTTNTGGIGTIQGFPPKVTQALHPVDGYVVTQRCLSDNGQSTTPPPSASSELDVGVNRRAPGAGGGWTGFTVTYRVGVVQYIVTWDTGLYACGTGAPVSPLCLPPGSQ